MMMMMIGGGRGEDEEVSRDQYWYDTIGTRENQSVDRSRDGTIYRLLSSGVQHDLPSGT